jgi:hypothetical protein
MDLENLDLESLSEEEIKEIDGGRGYNFPTIRWMGSMVFGTLNNIKDMAHNTALAIVDLMF